jgi:hypothetical protein
VSMAYLNGQIALMLLNLPKSCFLCAPTVTIWNSSTLVAVYICLSPGLPVVQTPANNCKRWRCLHASYL